jgi:hypothetical protein
MLILAGFGARSYHRAQDAPLAASPISNESSSRAAQRETGEGEEKKRVYLPFLPAYIVAAGAGPRQPALWPVGLGSVHPRGRGGGFSVFWRGPETKTDFQPILGYRR